MDTASLTRSSSPWPASSSESSQVDENTSLLQRSSGQTESSWASYQSSDSDAEFGKHAVERRTSRSSVRLNYQGIQWGYNVVLLSGIFLVNADSSVLMAMFRQIASDFDNLSSASWIITGYVMGMIVAQPLYGKLSDIYGRKPLLVVAYLFYCIGGLLSGTSVAFWTIVLGRTLAGIGNAGITALVSTLIVDMVPLRQVALWRSYVYSVNQIGRALGPPLGGWVADTADWRWALLFQVPLNLIGLVVIWFKMPIPKTADQEDHEYSKPKFSRNLRRIDFSGATTLGISNVALLLFFDQMEKNLHLEENLPAVVALACWVTFLGAFVVVERYITSEPMLPLQLMMRRNVLSSYLIQFFQTAAQMGLYTSIPLYFRTAEGDSNTRSSFRLLFITAGTVVGGLISGWSIKRSGRYRLITLLSIGLSNLSFLAIYLRWRGETGWGETAYGFPIGLGFGVSLSAAFIGLTAGMEHGSIAIATGGFYLSLNLGSLFGVSVVSLMIQSYVRRTLRLRLAGLPDYHTILDDALSNLDKIEHFGPKIMKIVQGTYIEALVWVWLFSLLCGCFAFAATWIMKEGEIERQEKGKSVHTVDDHPIEDEGEEYHSS